MATAFVCFGGVGLRLPGGPAVLRCFQSVWQTMPEDVALGLEGGARMLMLMQMCIDDVHDVYLKMLWDWWKL